MPETFDPYYKWLGIPPKDQPPHAYRLLGIELFESDREVIDAAANRIMSYLKDLAAGDESQLSQKLLNEIAQARLLLLNAAKKTAYDAELQAKLEADGRAGKPAAKAPPPRAGKPVPAPPPAVPGPLAAPAAAPPPPLHAPPTLSPPTLSPPALSPPLPAAPPNVLAPAAAGTGGSGPVPVLATTVGAAAAATRHGGSALPRPTPAAKIRTGVAHRRHKNAALLWVAVGVSIVLVIAAVIALAMMSGGRGDKDEQGRGKPRRASAASGSGPIVPLGRAGGSPRVLLQWSSQDVPNVKQLRIDGKAQSLPPQFEYVLEPGLHEFVIERNDGMEARFRVKLDSGHTRAISPRFQPASEFAVGQDLSDERDLATAATDLQGLDLSFNSSASAGPTAGFGNVLLDWPLDDDLTDVSRHQRTAMLTGAAQYAVGRLGRAIKLTADQRLEAAGPLLSDASEFSFAFWLNLEQPPIDGAVLADFGGDTTLSLHGGCPKLRVSGEDPGPGGSTDSTSFAFTGIQFNERLGQWTHFALVYSRPLKRVHYYRDGSHVGSQSFATAAPVRLEKLSFGQIAGSIDDVLLCDYRLGAENVKQRQAGTFTHPRAAPAKADGMVVIETWEGVDSRMDRRQIEAATALPPAQRSSASPATLSSIVPAGSGDQLSRIRGFLFPPQTGDYRFSIVSPGQAALYLQQFGPDFDTLQEIPMSQRKKLTASGLVPMAAGQAYYFEIFCQSSVGKSSRIELEWLLPDPTARRPVAVPASAFAAYQAVP